MPDSPISEVILSSSWSIINESPAKSVLAKVAAVIWFGLIVLIFLLLLTKYTFPLLSTVMEFPILVASILGITIYCCILVPLLKSIGNFINLASLADL